MGRHGRSGMLSTLFNNGPFLLLLLIQVCSQLAVAGSLVKFLPGFDGPLPFELETGYLGVDESDDVQLFYYFIKSESNPGKDPLILWISGGPGCSAFYALAYEIGPLTFKPVEYDGNLPKLVLNPHSWTKVASIIFLDFPVGAGYSYGRTPKASHSIDLQACDQASQFLRKWLVDHPAFISNPFYLGGDSYSGIPIPIITQMISNGNDVRTKPTINLKGYILGNPITNEAGANYKIPFAHGMGLISDELYESLEKNCKGEYFYTDSSTPLCSQVVQKFNELVGRLNVFQILEPNCPRDPPIRKKLASRSSLFELIELKIQDFRTPEQVSASSCGVHSYWLAYYWANDKSVQDALYVKKGTRKEWQMCNFDVNITKTIGDSRLFHASLSRKGYRSLIYSGDHDLAVPFLSTQAWIRALNYPIIDDWRQWIVNGQVAGYTRTYANQMTFATVKGGSHMAAENKQAECRVMFERWISSQPL